MHRHTYTFLASPQPRNEVDCTAAATLRAERQPVSYHPGHSPMGPPAAVISQIEPVVSLVETPISLLEMKARALLHLPLSW